MNTMSQDNIAKPKHFKFAASIKILDLFKKYIETTAHPKNINNKPIKNLAAPQKLILGR